MNTLEGQISIWGTPIKEQFDVFHKTNPVVFHELIGLADQLRSRGHKRGSMKMLFEVLRWERMIRTDDPSSEFKLNNNYTSHYARLMVETHPRFEGFFAIRHLRS
jgi:hypothetical protein